MLKGEGILELPSRKMMQIQLFLGQEYTDIHNGHVNTVGEGGDGTDWGIGIDTYVLPRATQIASGKLL